jgi:hypothetical protein
MRWSKSATAKACYQLQLQPCSIRASFPFRRTRLKRSSFGSSKVGNGTLALSFNVGLQNFCQMVMAERVVVASAAREGKSRKILCFSLSYSFPLSFGAI